MSDNSDRFRVETETGDNISNEQIKEIGDIFMETFSNAPYGQFLFYPSEGRAISAADVFGQDSGYIPLARLNEYDLENHLHPQTGERAVRWMEPEIVYQILRKKFRANLYIALLRDTTDQSIAGVNYGYFGTLREAFELEEWENPILYSGIERPNLDKNFSKAIEYLRDLLKGQYSIKENTEVFILSCTLTLAKARKEGLKNFLKMTNDFFQKIPIEMYSLPLLCEAIQGSLPYWIIKATDGNFLADFIENDHHIAISQTGAVADLCKKSSREVVNILSKTKKSFCFAGRGL